MSRRIARWPGPADHEPDRGDAVGQHHAELVDGHRIGDFLIREEVRVHIGQPGNEELPATIDHPRVRRHAHALARADGDDSPVAHQDRRILEDLLGGHRHDRHARDGECPRRQCPAAKAERLACRRSRNGREGAQNRRRARVAAHDPGRRGDRLRSVLRIAAMRHAVVGRMSIRMLPFV